MDESMMSKFLSYGNAISIVAMSLYEEYIESGLTKEYALDAVTKRLKIAVNAFSKPDLVIFKEN